MNKFSFLFEKFELSEFKSYLTVSIIIEFVKKIKQDGGISGEAISNFIVQLPLFIKEINLKKSKVRDFTSLILEESQPQLRKMEDCLGDSFDEIYYTSFIFYLMGH